MPTSVVNCQCGAKVELPPASAARTVACPQCHAQLALAADATVLAATPLDAGRSAMCPICQTAIAAGEACVTCPGCDLVHHRECWAEIGGCGTFGCQQAPAIDKSQHDAQAPLTAWGDTKKCPACGETIKSIAVRCRYCRTDFRSVDPMSLDDLRHQTVAGKDLEKMRRSVVALFVVSLIGCLAPLIAPFAAVYLFPRREMLAKCGPLYKIMGWTSLALSCFFCVLLLLFFVAEMQ